jgi:hypothetical protein
VNNSNIRLIIIDSHRPIWHGYNDDNSDNLVLLDSDDPVPIAQIPNFEENDEILRAGECCNTAACFFPKLILLCLENIARVKCHSSFLI